MAQSAVAGLEMDEEKYLDLLSKLIGETKLLQNNPPDSIPVEDRAVRHVLEVLTPFSEENGGPLNIQHISFVEGRGNLIITYPGKLFRQGGIPSFHFTYCLMSPGIRLAGHLHSHCLLKAMLNHACNIHGDCDWICVTF